MRNTRQHDKKLLLQAIEQQRYDLSLSARQWLHTTSALDKGWDTLYQMRKIIFTGLIFFAVYNIRQPTRLIRWSRYAVTALSSWNFLHRVLLKPYR